jgi:hypothetical protein
MLHTRIYKTEEITRIESEIKMNGRYGKRYSPADSVYLTVQNRTIFHLQFKQFCSPGQYFSSSTDRRSDGQLNDYQGSGPVKFDTHCTKIMPTIWTTCKFQIPSPMNTDQCWI